MHYSNPLDEKEAKKKEFEFKLKKYLEGSKKMKITKEEKEILDKISLRTRSDYQINECYDIDSNMLLVALEEALGEIEHLEDLIRDMNQDIEDNYRAISKEEQIYG